MKCHITKKRIAGLLGILLIVAFTACKRQPIKVVSTNTAMGTVIQYTVYATDGEIAENVVEELQKELQSLETQRLSWRIEDSQVAIMNAQAGKTEGVLLSKELYGYLEDILEVSRESKGALDITLGKITAMWNLDSWSGKDEKAREEFVLPDEDALQSVLGETGYERVLLKDGRIYLPKGMNLDLGAVGKGIACDRIRAYLENQQEITGAVISVGGSIVTYGKKPDGSFWKVAIMHPREEGAYLGTLTLQGEWNVATSGDYERYVEMNGKRYHHILDPSTGYPVDNELCSVTILSKDGLLSDALSTACFVLGAEEGKKLVEVFGAEALFVTKKQEVIMTEGMKDIFEESK